MNFLNRHRNFFIVLTLAVIAFFGTVGFWSGYHMKFKIHQFVKDKTGLDLKMGSAYVNPFTGKGHIKNIRIENPSGFLAKNAFSISELRFEGDRKTFYSDSINFNHVVVRGIELNFEPKGEDSNFQKIYFQASKYYKGSGFDTDEWFKPIKVGLLEIDPITINLGPKVINKNMTVNAVSIDGLVGDADTPLTYRAFRDILFGRYIKEIKNTLNAGAPMNSEMKDQILRWVILWEQHSG